MTEPSEGTRGDTRGRVVRRVAASVVAAAVALSMLAANADSSLESAQTDRREIRETIVDVQQLRKERRIEIHQEIKRIRQRLRKVLQRAGAETNREHAKEVQGHHLGRIGDLRKKERKLVRRLRARVVALRTRRAELRDWIENLPLQACPMGGPHEISDNFGVIREMPGTPRHIHQGNDISAATGTPIVAPFPGEAVMSPNHLGGQSVKVYGEQGYVYNAHLSAYGKLGPVETGDVIGYVGSTGNATGPHNHFEWHPGDGAAIDPFEVLTTVC